MDELAQAEYGAQLASIQHFLQELNWTTELIQEGTPVPVLIVTIPRDPQGRERAVTLTYIPLDDDMLEQTTLLMVYTTLPFGVDAARRSQLDLLVQAANALIPIGAFGHKENGEIFMRYTLALPRFDTVPQQLLVESVLLFIGMLDMLSPSLEAVASGKQEAAKTIKDLNLQTMPGAQPRQSSRAIDRVESYLASIGWEYQFVGEAAVGTTRIGALGEYNCFISVDEEDSQVVCYCVIPQKISPQRRSAMADFLTRANYGLYLGNFEMDFDDGEVRFKTSLAFRGDLLTFPLLAQVIQPCVAAMNQYWQAIVQVNKGTDPAAAILLAES
jgi:hypothetical protein